MVLYYGPLLWSFIIVLYYCTIAHLQPGIYLATCLVTRPQVLFFTNNKIRNIDKKRNSGPLWWSYIIVLYYSPLLWSFTMVLYYCPLLWSFPIVLYYGSLLLFFIIVLYYGTLCFPDEGSGNDHVNSAAALHNKYLHCKVGAELRWLLHLTFWWCLILLQPPLLLKARWSYHVYTLPKKSPGILDFYVGW